MGNKELALALFKAIGIKYRWGSSVLPLRFAMDTLFSRATEFSHISKMKWWALYLVLRGMGSNICIGYCVEYIRKVCTEGKNHICAILRAWILNANCLSLKPNSTSYYITFSKSRHLLNGSNNRPHFIDGCEIKWDFLFPWNVLCILPGHSLSVK